MRVRTLARWLTITLWGGLLAPAALAQSAPSEPLPQPTVLTVRPQENQDKPAPPAVEAAPGTPLSPPARPLALTPVTVPCCGTPGMMPALPGQVLGTNVAPALCGGMPPLSESAAGFIDSALIGTHVRVRLDGRFNNTRPDRSAYIMTKTQELPVAALITIPQGNGMPFSERKIDMAELTLYGEYAVTDRCSVFGAIPLRALQPDINDSHVGLGDISFGGKLAVFALPDLVQTLQCRVYCPTGDPREGMGSDLVAIEPAIMVYNRLTPRWTLEGEIRDWIPLGQPEFAGSVLHYGVTAAYDLATTANGWSVRPVFGLWGVAFLQGRQTIITPAGPILENARERILNGDIGVRVGGEGSSLYLGYSQVLTGSALFDHEVRLEWRYNF